MLTAPVADLQKRAELLAAELIGLGWDCRVIPTRALLGGGSAPEESIPSAGIAVTSVLTPNTLERNLRTGFGIIARIEREQVILDLRTVLPDQDGQLLEAFRQLSESLPETAPGQSIPCSPARD
jgi:L-seryl-tRNA(Ser) seleniumtransferase